MSMKTEMHMTFDPEILFQEIYLTDNIHVYKYVSVCVCVCTLMQAHTRLFNIALFLIVKTWEQHKY